MSSSLDQWQRLSPVSVVFFLGKAVVRLIKDALPVFAPMAVVIFASGNKLFTSSLAVAAIIAFLIGRAILQFWFFKFRRDGDKVLINDGVLQKNHRVIRFSRVQNINILTPIYFRPFGLVTLQIETAGSKGSEADLAGIPLSLADYLRELILKYQSENVSDQQEQFSSDHATVGKSTIVSSASLKDVIAYGVSSNGVFLFLALLAPLFGTYARKMANLLEDNITRLTSFLGGSTEATAVLLLLGLVAAMFLFSIIGAIYRYYGYQLTNEQQTLKRRSGLITHFEESLKLIKVQAFITQSNFIGRMIKRQNVILGQVSAASPGKPGKKNIFIVPARKEQQIPALLSLVFDNSPSTIPEEKIDRRFILKTWLVSFVAPIAIVTGLLARNEGHFYLFTATATSLVALLLVIKRWSMFRYGFTDGYGFFRSGLFGFKKTLFPIYKVQFAEVRQSPLQRRRNLASLRISLASNTIVIPYISLDIAEHYLKVIRETVAANKQPWY